MAANAMITREIYLDAQPGGIPPVLHLKQHASSMLVRIYLRKGAWASEGGGYAAVLKGIRPDGSGFFITASLSNPQTAPCFQIRTQAHLAQLTEVPGRFPAELSILKTGNPVTQENYGDFDAVTAAKFYVDIEESAYREGGT